MNEFELFLAHNGKEAYKIALQEEPDVILIDVVMPEMNGIDAIKALRKLPAFKHTPIIVLTSVKDLQQAYDAGANDFVAKPFEMYELIIRIKHSLDLVKSYHQIKSQNEKIKEYTENIQLQRETIAYHVESKMDDLRYSSRIQNVILPIGENINTLFPHHFILNKPKNVVGGDFYWISKVDKKIIAILGDCTGHGVSGALLSIASITFINEIANQASIESAADFLNKLRTKVIDSLLQNRSNGEPNDGMDVAVCIFDMVDNKLNFAGANNPIYKINRLGQLEILKPDRMPVGIHSDFSQSFNNVYVDIEQGESFYLFSDGFADQFGGPNEQKFRYKRLQELLLQIYKKPMKEQKHILDQTISNWKDSRNQVDDILILGIRI